VSREAINVNREYFSEKNLQRLKKTDLLKVAKYLGIEGFSLRDRNADIIDGIVEFIEKYETEQETVADTVGEAKGVPMSVRVRRIKESRK